MDRNPSPKARRNRSLRNLCVAAALLVVIVVGLSLPMIMGVISLGGLLLPTGTPRDIPGTLPAYSEVQVAGLTGDNVTIFRDQWGVPHLYGHDEADLIYALGYCHAQDRIFQMDMARRLTRGRMAEILGPDMLPTDQFNLLMLKDYWARETLWYLRNSTDPEVQRIYALLQEYVAGINFYLEHVTSRPVEYRVLGFDVEPWTVMDTLVYAKYMAEMLTWSYSDMYRLMTREALGAANYSALFGSPQPYQVPICPNYGAYADFPVPPGQPSCASSTSRSTGSTHAPAHAPAPASAPSPAMAPGLADVSTLFHDFTTSVSRIPQEQARLEQGPMLGSNNWVVSGAKTASGAPILCNDMHLAWNVPGIWYEAHLVDESTGWNLYAFFLAGVPVPLVGHNQHVAWGFTNTGYDVIDWYYYTGINETHYEYRGVATPYETMTVTIPVKDQAPVPYTIKQTVHGPVFTSLVPTASNYSSQPIACRWIAHNVTLEFLALYGYAHATNRTEFDAASRFFGAPAQNHVYADVHGHIGIRPTGWVPLRDDAGIPAWHLGNGSMPYNGSAGHGEWIGYVPFEDLPHAENPSQGYLVSANQIIAGPEYFRDYTLQHDYAMGYRARRINTLLASTPDITVADMQRFQLDVYSPRAGNLTTYLLAVLAGRSALTPVQQAAFAALQAWDFQMDQAEAAPTIFNVWFDAFRVETFGDEMKGLGSPQAPSWAVLEKLTREVPSSSWFDDITTPAVETRDDLIWRAYELAVDALETYFGSGSVSDWTWGAVHQLYFGHLAGIGYLGAGPYPGNGTGVTVNPAWATVYANGKVRRGVARGGASERLIVDFGDLNQSVSVIPSGQRGVLGSPHYTDQLELFLAGAYHPQYFSAGTRAQFLSAWRESTAILRGGEAA